MSCEIHEREKVARRQVTRACLRKDSMATRRPVVECTQCEARTAAQAPVERVAGVFTLA